MIATGRCGLIVGARRQRLALLTAWTLAVTDDAPRLKRSRRTVKIPRMQDCRGTLRIMLLVPRQVLTQQRAPVWLFLDADTASVARGRAFVSCEATSKKRVFDATFMAAGPWQFLQERV